jgi:hypothetical protein
MNNVVTIQNLIDSAGLTPDAARMAWRRMDLSNFLRSRIATEQEIAVFTAKYSSTPIPTKATSKPKSTATVPANIAKPKPLATQRISKVNIYDLLMWADMLIGLHSLVSIFGITVGGLIGLKVCFFFEQARRIVRRTTPAMPEYGQANYHAALEQAEAIGQTKRINTAIVIACSAAFCWANGAVFYTGITEQAITLTPLAHDLAARAAALIVTLIAIGSMYSLKSLSNAAVK